MFELQQRPKSIRKSHRSEVKVSKDPSWNRFGLYWPTSDAIKSFTEYPLKTKLIASIQCKDHSDVRKFPRTAGQILDPCMTTIVHVGKQRSVQIDVNTVKFATSMGRTRETNHHDVLVFHAMALDSPVVQGFQSCLERDHSCVVKAMNHKSISRELKNVRLGVIVLVDSGFTGEMAEKSWESICKSSKPVVLVQLADW